MQRAPRSNLSILLSWYTDPRNIPPFVLSPSQITVGPKVRPDQQRMMFAGRTPLGVYDLKVAVQSQGLPTRYDLVVVYADASHTNFPLNLGAFDCPKVLVVGDTHHLESPLRRMVEYASDARFDFVVSICNRQHLHWFTAAGFPRVAWFPSLAVQHMARPLRPDRKSQLGFVGQLGGRHVRRERLIALLRSSGLPIVTATGSREFTADVYAESAACFNASLNGDVNFRVFEVLSAGGCLLTDRLAPQSGLDVLLKEDTHYFGYDSPEELVDKARYLLRHPERTIEVARCGHVVFVESMLPDKRAADLLTWVFEDRLDDLYRPPAREQPEDATTELMDRMRIYETLQQLHLERERPRVLFDPAVPRIYRSDAADLRRLETVVATQAQAAGEWDGVISAGENGITWAPA